VISFDLPERSTVDLAIYDVLGRKVVDLLDEEVDAGTHNLYWTNEGASGVYFIRFQAVSVGVPMERYIATKKCIALK
jgi:hypothetical protein